VELITRLLAETIMEARREAPIRAHEEEGEESTYSSDRGLEPAAQTEEEKKRRRRTRRRRAKPEAIAKRLKTGEEGEVEAVDAVDAVDEGGGE
jgi:small subunit ribosomal protein S2